MHANSHLGLDVGQANELKLAFRKYSYDNELIKRLCEGDILGDVLDVLRGDAHVAPVRRRIDLSAEPALKSPNHAVVKHLRQGKKFWDEIRLALIEPDDLHYTPQSVPHKHLRGSPKVWDLNWRTMMPKYLHGQRPANSCLRDFLIENPHLVPRHWCFSRPILFWGTVCKNDSCEYVPGMTRSFGKWEVYDRRIDRRGSISLGYDNPCVVFA